MASVAFFVGVSLLRGPSLLEPLFESLFESLFEAGGVDSDSIAEGLLNSTGLTRGVAWTLVMSLARLQ